MAAAAAARRALCRGLAALFLCVAVLLAVAAAAATAAPTTATPPTTTTATPTVAAAVAGAAARPLAAARPAAAPAAAAVSRQIACPGPELGQPCDVTCCTGLCCWRSVGGCPPAKRCVRARVFNGLERC